MTSSASSLVAPGALAQVSGVTAGFSTRLGGTSEAPYASLNVGTNTGDADENVRANRHLLLRSLGLTPDRLALAGQVHGDEVVHVDAPGFYEDCDGLVTREPGLALGITTADCAAVLIADPEAGVVGACHSGWRGTVANIVQRTVDELARLGGAPSRMHAAVGPCISVENFEVGEEVAARFDDSDVHRRPDWERPHVDIKSALVKQLIAAGLPEAAVDVSPFCTFGRTDRFFSHRREDGITGRMMGIVALVT